MKQKSRLSAALKLPSCSGASFKYLGRFAQDKFLREGHNTNSQAKAFKAIRDAFSVEEKKKKEQEASPVNRTLGEELNETYKRAAEARKRRGYGR